MALEDNPNVRIDEWTKAWASGCRNSARDMRLRCGKLASNNTYQINGSSLNRGIFMAKYFIIGETGRKELWLVDIDSRTVSR